MRPSLLAPGLLAFVAPAFSQIQYRGVDWSSALIEERAGIIYKDSAGVAKPLETILVEAGINLVRQRVWVKDGDYGIDYNLELAQRAVNAGMMFGLNLHLSNDWTNPELQEIPPEWPRDIEGLVTTVYGYVLGVCNTFEAAGLHPELITLGNEINSGILSPVGSYENPENLSLLLKTASQAVRDSSLSIQPKLLIHNTLCCDPSRPQWFYDLILGAGHLTLDDFDVQAFSMYPFWGPDNNFELLKEMTSFLKSTYGKEVQIVESNYPTVCTNPTYEWPADILDIPISVAGQEIYLDRMGQVLNEAGINGYNYWEPAWVSFTSLGSSCEQAILFDTNGQAHPGLAAIGRM